ncbi:bacteriohemerythrin [Methylogaea oryzae]|uniref:Hemerythrin-like domain-containing protein n=1 Tax=Methylogaea oryzae TaxID=1295382 RepID=A0A8D5AGP6_9GAMM|nr:hemerythrin family protein [Methylogaea oryzae]BBL70603.1 hypothetical protein MoryE10_12090 [Methylogaea oryzae]
MAIFSWKNDYRVGDATIDAQHEYLFALANEVVGSQSRAELTNHVMKLYRYVREHFSHEEAVMKQTSYPSYQEHIAMHDQLMAQLTAISDSIGKDQWSVDELQRFMNQWLLGHILEVDTQLAAFLGKTGEPSSPVS